MALKPPPPQAPRVMGWSQPAIAGPPPPLEGAPPDGTPLAPPPPPPPPPTHTAWTPPMPLAKPKPPPLTQPFPTEHVATPKPPPRTTALPKEMMAEGASGPLPPPPPLPTHTTPKPAPPPIQTKPPPPPPPPAPCPCEDCRNQDKPRQISKNLHDDSVMAVHRRHLANLYWQAFRPSQPVPAPEPKSAPPAPRRCEFCGVPVESFAECQRPGGTRFKCRHCFCWQCLRCGPSDSPQLWQCPICEPRVSIGFARQSSRSTAGDRGSDM